MEYPTEITDPLLPCPFCARPPRFVNNEGACGFKCTCGGKRFIHTYYDSTIPASDMNARIKSAVDMWNHRDTTPPTIH